MTLRLLGNRVLVEPLSFQHWGSPIHRVDRYEPEPMIYWVIAVGTGKLLPNGQRRPIEIAPGEKCLLNPATSNRHPAGHNRYIVEADDIQMVWV